MSYFKKAIKYTKPSLEIDEKIRSLDQDLKKTLGEAIVNSTSGIYSILGFEPGDPPIPPIPEVPPTYEDVTGGLGGDGSDFEWPDQGDGNPDNSTVVPNNLYTTYDGQQVPAIRYIDTYNGQTLDYGDDLPIGAVAFRSGWLGWNYLGYLGGSGIRGVGTTRFPSGDIGSAIYAAYNNWPFEGKIVKQVYQWQNIDCLFGSCKGGSQYYPSGTSSSSSDGSPLADRVLYQWTVWLPADADGNLLKNRILTDPGSPAVPGVPEGPPKPVVLSRNGLGDPNYYSGDPSNFLMGLLNLGKRGYDYIIKAMSDRSAARANPPPPPPPNDPDEPEIPPGGAMVKTDSGYAVLNASQLAAYRAGGGESAINGGKSFQDVMRQGSTNLSNLNRKTKVNPNAGQLVFQSIANTVADVVVTGLTGGVPVSTVLRGLNQIKNTLPGVGTRVDIATSMISGKPIVYNEKDIPQYQKNALLNNIAPGSVKISYGEERPYSDDNIVVDKNGKVRPNDGSSPNLTQPTSYNSSGFFGAENPLHAAGQAQQQFVVPSDGSEPYYVYTDHAYYNAASKDPGEIPQADPISPVIARGLQNVTPGMKGYPPNIKGDVVKTFRVPYSQLPPNARQVIDKEMEYQDLVRSGRVTKIQEQYLSEGWESPKHTNIEKNQKNRWFNPNDIAPEYPKEPPAPMVGGYSSKSLLAPKPIDREPVIKITKKDLARNHKLTDTEIKDMMDTINELNAFLAAHPEELIHAQIRYPKHDPRLAELNWKMDQMIGASKEYLDTQFPENKTLFKRLQKSIGLNIKLTDPKTFKDVEDPIIYDQVFVNKEIEKKRSIYNPNKKINKNFFKRIVKTKKDTSRARWLRKDK